MKPLYCLRGLLVAALLAVALPLHAQTDYLQEGIKATDLATKVQLLTRAIQNAPSATAYLHRGYAFLSQGYPDAALEDFRKGLAAPGQENPASFYAGMSGSFFQRGEYDNAIVYADKALAVSPTYTYPLGLRAQALINLQRYDQALAVLDNYLRLSPQDANGPFWRAFANMGLKRYDDALTDIDRALVMLPGNTQVLQRKLVILDRLGRQQEVYELARRLTQFADNDPLSLSNIGVIYQNNSEYQLAIDYHGRAIRMFETRMAQDPEYRKANLEKLYNIYLNRGNAHYMLRNYSAALGDYNLASQALPNLPEAWRLIGQLQVQSRNYAEAITAYERCFRLAPDSKDGWVNLGFAYSETGRRDLALKTYDRALAIPGVLNRGLLLNNRGFTHFEMKRPDLALADLRAAIADNPNLAMAHISLGELYLDQKQYADAKGRFDHALDLPTLDARERWTAYYRRALAQAQLGDTDRAIADLRAATEADPTYADAWEQLGILLLQKGQLCDARSALQTSLQKKERMDRDRRPDVARMLNDISTRNRTPC